MYLDIRELLVYHSFLKEVFFYIIVSFLPLLSPVSVINFYFGIFKYLFSNFTDGPIHYFRLLSL